MSHVRDIASGLMAAGERPFIPGVQCLHCGRFIGRDGWIEVEHFEMSSEIASVSGQCARCQAKEAAAEARAIERLTEVQGSLAPGWTDEELRAAALATYTPKPDGVS